MPARQERIPEGDSQISVGLILRESLGGLALFDMAIGLFPNIPYTTDDLESRRGHVVFSRGSHGCVLVPRVLDGDGYKNNAENLRDGFSRLGFQVDGTVWDNRAAGFTYSLALGEPHNGAR